VTKKQQLQIKGSALVLTILGIAAMTTLTLGVAQLVPDDFRQIQAFEGTLSAEQAAWSGVEHALYLIKSARAQNSYFELSSEYNASGNSQASRPFGRTDTIGRCFTRETRSDCPGIDRQLGDPTNQTPVSFTNLNTADTEYRLVVWHRRQNIGNTNDLDDYYPSAYPNNLAKLLPETLITPTLDRDEVRRLDVRGASFVRLRWKPVYNSFCKPKVRTRPYLYIAQIGRDGNVISSIPPQLRLFPPHANFSLPPGQNPDISGVDQTDYSNSLEEIVDIPLDAATSELSIRFLVTSDAAGGNGDESDISGCYMRYSLENNGSVNDSNRAIETSDLGFDVIESTGISGRIQRKIRVLVNRENGNPLSILDFSIACENCERI
jgi:hypothetical protein